MNGGLTRVVELEQFQGVTIGTPDDAGVTTAQAQLLTQFPRLSVRFRYFLHVQSGSRVMARYF